MRRPLPPELIVLGDQLEAAAARSVARRRTRRQQALNALTGLVVALPLALTLATSEVVTTRDVPSRAPTSTTQPSALIDLRDSAAMAELRDAGETLVIPDDFLPRDLRRRRQASPDMLVLPSSLRPALR